MDQEKIGNLISKLRKELGLTQSALGEKLGVSSKTVSKWECGNGLPDITSLKEISNILGITIEELLEGNTQTKEKLSENKKLTKKILIPIIALPLIIVIIISLVSHKNHQVPSRTKENCIVIRTYYIDNIGKSNDENYLYITVHEYQVEGTFTLKLPKLISKDLEVGSSYEFTFKTNEKYIKTTTDILFNNSNVINLQYTDKVGNERVSKYECN